MAKRSASAASRLLSNVHSVAPGITRAEASKVRSTKPQSKPNKRSLYEGHHLVQAGLLGRLQALQTRQGLRP